jgi:hypothetical protein
MARNRAQLRVLMNLRVSNSLLHGVSTVLLLYDGLRERGGDIEVG